MVVFKNNSSLQKNIFDSLIRTYISHSGLVQGEDGLQIVYTDSMPAVPDENTLYILHDSELFANLYSRVYANEDCYILNAVNSQWDKFFENGITMLYVRNNTYLLSFDVLGNLYYNIFMERPPDIFNDYSKSFSENLIALFSDCIIRIMTDLNMKCAFISSTPKGYEAYALPTFDIDRINYFYNTKSLYYLLRYIVSFFRNRTYFELKKKYRGVDPWNNLEELLDIMKRRKLKGIFFMMAVKRDRFGIRYSLNKVKYMMNMLQEHTSGIHLSYESSIEERKIEREVRRISGIMGKVIFSRFHYIPDPGIRHFREMENAGIVFDSSSGMRKQCGFAKGFCKPYFIPGTDIVEIPVICMDSAIANNIEQCGEQLAAMDAEIRKSGGFFTYIFHQSTLSEHMFSGFRGIFEGLNRVIAEHEYYNDEAEKMIGKFISRTEKAEWRDGKLEMQDGLEYEIEIY